MCGGLGINFNSKPKPNIIIVLIESMDMGLKIKEAAQEDIEGLKSFFFRAWREAGPEALGWTGASKERLEHIASHDFLSSLINRDDVRIFLAWKEEDVVGFASNSKVDEDIVELSGIIVLESRTGIGIGSKLLESSIKSAKLDGFNTMVVKTEIFNDRAIQFYRRKGFKIRETTEEEIEGVKVELLILDRAIDK